MNCAEMKARLDGMPGSPSAQPFTAEELGHLSSCADCGEYARSGDALRGRIAAAGELAGPGDAYWAAVLPRVNAQISRRSAPGRLAEIFAPARFLAPAAGLAAAALFFLAVRVTDPAGSDQALTIASLSETELRDLGASVKYTGLLDHSNDAGWGIGPTITDFLAEIAAGGDDAELYAAVDPVEVLGEVDSESFGRIVEILKSK